MSDGILIAGIGNIFLGDDGFGVAVAQRLMRRDLPPGVHVADFGIRGIDLAYALLEPYEAFILIDAAPRGDEPGTLYAMEIDPDEPVDSDNASPDAHAMNPLRVLQIVKAMGGRPKRVLLIGCEPRPLSEEELQVGCAELSWPVEAAVEEAARMACSLAASLAREPEAVATA